MSDLKEKLGPLEVGELVYFNREWSEWSHGPWKISKIKGDLAWFEGNPPGSHSLRRLTRKPRFKLSSWTPARTWDQFVRGETPREIEA